jgi:hypothetical protein
MWPADSASASWLSAVVRRGYRGAERLHPVAVDPVLEREGRR